MQKIKKILSDIFIIFIFLFIVLLLYHQKFKTELKIYFTAMLQVCFVAMNINFIAKGYIFLMILTGFSISFLWATNVQRIALGKQYEKYIYASGAATGTILGYYLSKTLIQII